MQDRLNFYHPEKRPWPNPCLTRTSIIGHTTPTTVRLWFRVSSPGNYWLVVTETPIPRKGVPYIQESSLEPTSSPTLLLSVDGDTEAIPTIKLCQMTFNPEQDLTQVVNLTALEPNTRYYYGLFPSNDSQSWELGQEEILSFQTFPDQDPRELTFGIYSCHMPYQGKKLVNLELWESFYQELKHHQARFIIGMGDQVYVDGKDRLSIWSWLKKVKRQNPTYDDMVSWYRDIYRGYWGIEPLQRVLRSFPTYMIWDDHEIFDGWGSYTESELVAQVSNSWQLENAQKNLHLARAMFKAATQVYEEYQHSHNPPTVEPGQQNLNQFDYSFNYGSYGFYILDMRGHRDFNRQEFRILGRSQWRRFESWVSSQDRDNSQILLIVSSVPIVHLNTLVVNTFDIPYLSETDDLRDHWEHRSNWQERDRLLNLLFEFSHRGKRPVIFLSGDVHLGACFDLAHPSFPDARVFQLTSSPITYGNLNKFKRQILAILVKNQGNLGDFAGNQPYQFKNLHLCLEHNFGLVRVQPTENGELSLNFDLFSKTDETNGLINKKTIKLV